MKKNIIIIIIGFLLIGDVVYLNFQTNNLKITIKNLGTALNITAQYIDISSNHGFSKFIQEQQTK